MFGDILNEELKQPYFSWVFKLFELAPEAEIFLVGGAARDAFLGRPTKDYDFVVRGVQARRLQDFLASTGIVNLVGRTFGVYKFIPDHGYTEFKASGLEAFDLALPRTEKAWGTGGYKDVEVQSDHTLPIEDDLSRRDFTINAMALKFTVDSSQFTALIDPYGGQKDLEAKVIRAVGNPRERFEEDYTRMLRALRFACELNFTIEDKTMAALQSVMVHINAKRAGHEYVAPREVISKEMIKAFYVNPTKAFDLCDESGAFSELIPELQKMKGCPQPEEFHSEGDVWTHTRLALTNLKTEGYKSTFGDADPHYNTLLVMAVLFHDIGKPPMLKTPEQDGVDRVRFDEHDTVGSELAREIARRLVLSVMIEGSLHVDYDKLHWLIKHHLLLLHTKAEDFKAATVEKYFFNDKNPGEELLRLAFCDGSATIPKNGTPTLQNLFDMQARIKRMETAIKEKRIPYKPFINGDEIMKILKIPAGPGVGEIIRSLREEQLSARVTTKDDAVAWLKQTFG